MKTYKFMMVLLLIGLFALMIMGAQGCVQKDCTQNVQLKEKSSTQLPSNTEVIVVNHCRYVVVTPPFSNSGVSIVHMENCPNHDYSPYNKPPVLK